MGVKIISVGNKIQYCPAKNDTVSIKFTKVDHIKYKDGSIYTIRTNSDTTRGKVKPYILVSGGVCLPSNTGYGGSSYLSESYDEGNTSGYAISGSIFSVTAGVTFPSGWEITGMFSNFRNQFNATSLMSEASIFSVYYSSNLNGTGGNYYYNNYTYLLGVSKSTRGNFVKVGFSLLLGALITTIPTMHATGVYYLNWPYGGQTVYNSNITMNSDVQADFMLDIGFHCDVNITKHVFLRGLTEIQISDLSPSGVYEAQDMSTGNIVGSGYYKIPGFSVLLFNATLGIGYRL